MKRICHLECYLEKPCPVSKSCLEIYKEQNIEEIWKRIIDLTIDYYHTTDPSKIQTNLIGMCLAHDKAPVNPVVRCDDLLAEKLWEFAGWSIEKDWFDETRTEKWFKLVEQVCNSRIE